MRRKKYKSLSESLWGLFPYLFFGILYILGILIVDMLK